MTIRRIAAQLLNFHGRATRKEYWTLLGALLIPFSLLLIVAGRPIGSDEPVDRLLAVDHVLLGLLLGIALLQGFAGIRRLHDSDSSGWWLLVLAIPYVGPGMFVYFMLKSPSKGWNRFGPDPRDPNPAPLQAPPPHWPRFPAP